MGHHLHSLVLHRGDLSCTEPRQASSFSRRSPRSSRSSLQIVDIVCQQLAWVVVTWALSGMRCTLEARPMPPLTSLIMGDSGPGIAGVDTERHETGQTENMMCTNEGLSMRKQTARTEESVSIPIQSAPR